MKKSHLVLLLRTFDRKEVKELRKWVNSPAHNLRQDVAQLFDYLVAPERLHNDERLEKEKVFAAVYPERTYSDAEMRQAMHFLFRAVENFLVYHELQKDEVRLQTMLAKVYRQRQLPKLFQKTMESAKETQARQPFRNHQYFENEYSLQFEQYTYQSSIDRSGPLNLQEVSDANDVAYLANKLQLSCLMLSHQAVFKANYQMHLLDDVLRQIETNTRYLETPAIAMYYHSFKAITNQAEESHFHELKKLLMEQSDKFPLEDMRGIYLLAINYCIGRINAGKSNFFLESFDLYKAGLVKGFILENNVLSRFTFRNVITAALSLQE